MRHYHISTRMAKIKTMENSKYWGRCKAIHFGKLLVFINTKTKHMRTLWTSSLIRWRRDRLPTPVFLGFPCGSASKESSCNAENLRLIPGLGRSPAEEKSYPLQYSGLENSMDCIVHGVTKSRTRLSNVHFTIYPVQMYNYVQQKTYTIATVQNSTKPETTVDAHQ